MIVPKTSVRMKSAEKGVRAGAVSKDEDCGHIKECLGKRPRIKDRAE